MLTTSLKKQIKKRVPQSLLDGVQIRLGLKFRVFDNNRVNEHQRRFYPNAIDLLPSTFLPNLYQSFYKKKSADLLIPSTTTPLAQSWVPFLKGKTSVFVYNFFERNYGIKDPIFYRFVILDEEGAVRSVRAVILGPSGIFSGPPPSVAGASLPDQGSLVVQAFHPRIKILDNQSRYWVFLGDTETDLNCAVHSMTVRPINHPAPLGYRSYGTPTTSAYLLAQPHAALHPKNGKQADIVRLASGDRYKSDAYFIGMNAAGNPTSIWHDQPVNHLVAPASEPKTLGACKTCVFVPQFPAYAPVMLITSTGTGFEVKKITVDLLDGTGKPRASKTLDIPHDDYLVDAQALFASESYEGPASLVIDFHRDMGEFASTPMNYIQAYHRGPNGFTDQVHSQSTFGLTNDPIRSSQGYRCRKFAPLMKSDNLKFFYGAFNVGSSRPNKDGDIFVRIITDTGAERRLRLPVPPEGYACFTGEDLMRRVDLDLESAAVVQYEHLSTNYNGSWHFVDEKRGTMGVDHFTGG